MDTKSYTIPPQAEQLFRDEVTRRYPDIESCLKRALHDVRAGLYAWAGTDPQAQALVGQIQRQLDARFGAHWPETASPLTAVQPTLRADIALATLHGAYSPMLGFKKQMYNPQILAHSVIMKTVHGLSEGSAVPALQAGDQSLMEVAREAARPLLRLPQYDDHQMHL